jgi:hypothetical protein
MIEVMKKILILLLLVTPLFLGGCIIYGKGQTNGYVYAVDDGVVWDKVWYKSSLQSSESDCYLINDDTLKEQLRSLPAETNIKLYYKRHLATVASCPEGTSTDDEITSYEIINKGGN